MIKGIKDRMKGDVEDLINSKKSRIIEALQRDWESQYGGVINRKKKNELEKISELPSVDEGCSHGDNNLVFLNILSFIIFFN